MSFDEANDVAMTSDSQRGYKSREQTADKHQFSFRTRTNNNNTHQRHQRTIDDIMATARSTAIDDEMAQLGEQLDWLSDTMMALLCEYERQRERREVAIKLEHASDVLRCNQRMRLVQRERAELYERSVQLRDRMTYLTQLVGQREQWW